MKTKRKLSNGVTLVDCPSCDRRMPEGRYVCAHCMREEQYKTKTPPLMASEPEFVPKRDGAGAGCHSCGAARRTECHERIRDGYWLSCEIPDAMDFLVAGKLDAKDLKDYAGGKTVNTWSRKNGKVHA